MLCFVERLLLVSIQYVKLKSLSKSRHGPENCQMGGINMLKNCQMGGINMFCFTKEGLSLGMGQLQCNSGLAGSEEKKSIVA